MSEAHASARCRLHGLALRPDGSCMVCARQAETNTSEPARGSSLLMWAMVLCALAFGASSWLLSGAEQLGHAQVALASPVTTQPVPVLAIEEEPADGQSAADDLSPQASIASAEITAPEITAPGITAPEITSRSVLFIGNSHSKHVPALLALLAKRAGVRLHTEQITPGGETLERRARDPKVEAAIASRPWDFVVLQEQSLLPGVPVEREASTVPAAMRLSSLVRSARAEPLLYMTWARRHGDIHHPELYPSDSFEAMHARVVSGLKQLSAVTSARVVPVGLAFDRVRRAHSGIELFARDGNHASRTGQYLSAVTFFGFLYGRDPTTLPALSAPTGLPRSQVTLLHEAARDALYEGLVP